MAETETNSGAKVVLAVGAALIAAAAAGGWWVSRQPDQEAAMRRLLALALGEGAVAGAPGAEAEIGPLWRRLPSPGPGWSRTDYLGPERAAAALSAAGGSLPETTPDDAAAAVFRNGGAAFTLYVARGGAAPTPAPGEGATIAGIAFAGRAGEETVDLLAVGDAVQMRILGPAPAPVLEALLAQRETAALPLE